MILIKNSFKYYIFKILKRKANTHTISEINLVMRKMKERD